MYKRLSVCACLIVVTLAPLSAQADLYSAAEAYQKQDFAHSFELYRELAELGRREGQENLAIMYVNAEGVKRDNVLGYAWAVIAKENGAGAEMQSIIDQLEPHLTAVARTRVAEVQAQFGMAALKDRLLPTPYSPATPRLGNLCEMRKPVNPDDYYPKDAIRKGISGNVTVDVTVAPDGRARSVLVWYSLPATAFEEAGRRVAYATGYAAPRVGGVAVTCTIRFRVIFGTYRGGAGPGNGGTPEQKKVLADVKAKAEAGDPRSQLSYGLALQMRSDMNVEKENFEDWFLKAAQGGIPAAQYIVGIQAMPGPGIGTDKVANKSLVWLQLAADAGQSQAQAALANYLLRNNPDAETLAKAQSLLEKSAASGNRDGKFSLAALLATAPDAARRDPKRALELINEVIPTFDFDPFSFEIRAAAEAQLGDFPAAQKDQSKAVQKAINLSWDPKDQKARLASYRAAKPWTGDLFEY